MAKHGMFFEIDPMTPDSIIRGVISTSDIEGGQPISLGAKHATEKDLFVASGFETGATGLYIAYNPARFYEEGADGQIRPSQIIDRRYQYNVKNMGFLAGKFEVGKYYGITMANIDGNTEPTVGKFLEPKTADKTYAIKDSQTADVTSFKVIDIKTIDVPTGDFTDGEEKVFVMQCMYN